jgi:hypothetical protein
MDNFKDYIDNPKALIGRDVIYISRYHKTLTTIKTAAKTRFTLNGNSGGNFRMSDGSEIFPSDRMYWGNSGRCQLLTPEEKQNYQRLFKEEKQSSIWRDEITKALSKLSYETLEKISKLI